MGIVLRLDQCCCGCQLRTGSKIVGWFNVIIGALGFFYDVLGVLDLLPKEGIHHSAHVYIFAALLCLLRIVFAFILLNGAYKEKVSYYLPWIVYIIVLLILECLGLISLLTPSAQLTVIVGTIISVCIDCYCILVVYSDYRQQKERNQGIEGIH